MLKHCLLLLLVAVTIPACARNWNAKMDWRAGGDGRTDDSPAIQRGMAALESRDAVGGENIRPVRTFCTSQTTRMQRLYINSYEWSDLAQQST
jgi:hypothetical protein